MTEIAIDATPVPLSLRLGSALQLSDDELFELCGRNPELRIERTAQGNLVVMTPAGGASGHRNFKLTGALALWVERDGTGVGFDSSTGFLLPNGAMRAPDAAWVLHSRLARLSTQAKEKFLPLCPDFAIELRSPSDRLSDLQAKMEEYRANGTRLGWLLDPKERRVYVYRPGRPIEVLEHVPAVSGDPELPGFILQLEPIWQPL